jgi:hypothetical protein
MGRLFIALIDSAGRSKPFTSPQPGGGAQVSTSTRRECMRFTKITLTCFCIVVTASFVMAQEKKQDVKTDVPPMMEVYKKLATPGAPHKLLASMAGDWNTKTKSWMEPNKPPMESTGTCEQKMRIGERFLQQTCRGDMMGSPFTGIGFTGYDNHTNKYVSTWMDSMGTGIYFLEGTASADGKTITQKGRYDDPVEGPMELRGVTKIVNGNTQVFEMYGTKKGKETKMMEITYTREKDSEKEDK